MDLLTTTKLNPPIDGEFYLIQSPAYPNNPSGFAFGRWDASLERWYVPSASFWQHDTTEKYLPLPLKDLK